MKTAQELRELKLQKDDYYRSIDQIIYTAYPDIKIFVGGCIERNVGSSFRHTAHAHNFPENRNFGCVCFRSIKRIGQYHEVPNDDGTICIVVDKPSQTLLHEIAHILTPKHGHDKKWLNKYIEIGASKGQIKFYRNNYKGCN